MFFLIPLIIFLSSVAIAIWMVARKFAYLRKLTPETVNGPAFTDEDFLTEFFPGLASWFKKKNIQEFRVDFLAEFEKFLRKLRLASLRIDTLTDRLIHRVRKSAAYHGEVLSRESAVPESIVEADGSDKKKDWKEEEQRLIIEIAKEPKNAELYKKLGDVYIKMKENQDALESFKKSLELNPGDDEAKSKLEKVSAKLKDSPA